MKVTFREEDHSYWVEGKQVPSVNQILTKLKVYDYGDLDPWYAERGTAVHKATELWDIEQLNPLTLDSQISGYVDGWIKFRKVHADIMFTGIEMVIYNDVFRYAGTVDRLCIKNNVPFVLDIKTSKQKAKWHSLQIDGYQRAIGAAGVGQIVYLSKEGDFELVSGRSCNFESFAEVYNWFEKR